MCVKASSKNELILVGRTLEKDVNKSNKKKPLKPNNLFLFTNNVRTYCLALPHTCHKPMPQ
jgi:hypothetical protein